MPEHQQMQQSTESKYTFQKQATPILQTPISNPASIIQSAKINPKSLTHTDILQLQRTIGNRAASRLLSGIRNPSTTQQIPVQRQESPEDKEPLQGKMMDTVQRQLEPGQEKLMQGKFASGLTDNLQAKKEVPPNKTGMPDHLKSGVENLSGMDLSDVRMHYNSSKPKQLNALAYTQGSDIHLAPGQERHLPHEAWHIVQQAQGRVKPTLQLKDGVPVNDDEKLEHEADVMGIKAMVGVDPVLVQEEMYDHHASPMVLQRMLAGEAEKYDPEHYKFAEKMYEKICLPLKKAETETVINNLRDLKKEYPPSMEKNMVFWNYFKQPGYNMENKIKPLKEYPGPIWMWPLQASGSLPPREQRGSLTSMEPWMNWKSSQEDSAQLNSFWELAKALARECAFLNAPPDLGTDPGAKDWLSRNLELREQDYQTIPENEPFARAKRMKSIRGIEAHLSRFRFPPPDPGVSTEPEPEEFGF